MKLLIHSQSSKVQPLNFGNGWISNFLSMLGLKLIHVSKRGVATVDWMRLSHGRYSENLEEIVYHLWTAIWYLYGLIWSCFRVWHRQPPFPPPECDKQAPKEFHWCPPVSQSPYIGTIKAWWGKYATRNLISIASVMTCDLFSATLYLNHVLLSTGPLGSNFQETYIKMQWFSSEMYIK